MFGLVPLLVIVAVALIFGGFYYWARRQGLLTAGQAAEGKQGTRRISLLTEAVGLRRCDPAPGRRDCRDQPAMERHHRLGAGGRPRRRRRVLLPGRHLRAPGP